MLILRRTLIGNRARPGGFLKKTFFSAFVLRSAGTYRMLISGRMLNRIQPRRPPIARYVDSTIFEKSELFCNFCCKNRNRYRRERAL